MESYGEEMNEGGPSCRVRIFPLYGFAIPKIAWGGVPQFFLLKKKNYMSKINYYFVWPFMTIYDHYIFKGTIPPKAAQKDFVVGASI
jgi:hypothetical protein